jgi:DNA-binding MarR family transcriptional regulator
MHDMNTRTLASQTEPSVLQLLDVAASLERRLDRALSMIRGISYREYRLLKTLAESTDDGLTRVALADLVGLTPSAVTRALKPLEKIGLVRTVKGERDARQSRALISSAGVELLKDAQGVLNDVFTDLPINSVSEQRVKDFQQRLNEFKRQD